jgi:peptidoglycan-associated lipoprotein
MKCLSCCNLFTVALVLTLGSVGCKKTPKGPTPIPGSRAGLTGTNDPFGSENTGRPIGPGEGTTSQPINPTEQGFPPGRFDPSTSEQDRGPLAAYTVYFDFDRSAIRSSETAKIESVASYLKGNPGVGVLIEGHCDERGTEQYNLSLGERRALAIREYLINLGIDGNRVYTISFGEDRPADLGRDESAWAKNRRGEFVVLRPKQ